MTDTKRMTNACNLVSQQLRQIAFGDIDLLNAIEGLKQSAFLAEERICHNKLIETVPGIAGVEWDLLVSAPGGRSRGTVLREVSFKDHNGDEVYGHTLVDGGSQIDFRFSKEFACLLLNKPHSYFDEPGVDMARAVSDRLWEAFKSTTKIAIQRLVFRGDKCGKVSLVAPEGPVATKRSSESQGPEQSR